MPQFDEEGNRQRPIDGEKISSETLTAMQTNWENGDMAALLKDLILLTGIDPEVQWGSFGGGGT